MNCRPELMRCSPRVAHRSSIQVAPGGRVVLIDQEFTTEVQNVLPCNEGNYIRRVINMLFINGVGLRAQYGAAVATLVVTIDLDVREVIGFGKLPSELGWISQTKGVRFEEVQLVGIPQPTSFVMRGLIVHTSEI